MNITVWKGLCLCELTRTSNHISQMNMALSSENGKGISNQVFSTNKNHTELLLWLNIPHTILINCTAHILELLGQESNEASYYIISVGIWHQSNRTINRKSENAYNILK